MGQKMPKKVYEKGPDSNSLVQNLGFAVAPIYELILILFILEE
jgi:hypothetical protein